MLSLEGCIATGDALYCNRPIVTTVLKRDGHYVLPLEKSRSKPFDAVARRSVGAGKRRVAKRTVNISRYYPARMSIRQK